jgi:hypothetical protein
MRCSELKANLKADYLGYKPDAQVQPTTDGEEAALRPVAVPVRVRWREFRVQLLPLLAFGSVLFLAGLLWRMAVLPELVSPLPDPPSGSGSTAKLPETPLLNHVPSLAPQVSESGTNTLGTLPAQTE